MKNKWEGRKAWGFRGPFPEKVTEGPPARPDNGSGCQPANNYNLCCITTPLLALTVDSSYKVCGRVNIVYSLQHLL